MTRRMDRMVGAVASLVAGGVHLALAGAARTPVRARGPLVIHYTEGAIFGARYVVLLAGLSLVLLARPLVHGKRSAWLLALAVALATLLGHHAKEADAIGALTSVALIAVLGGLHRSFHARSDPARARRGWQLLALGLGTMFVYGVAGLYLLGGNFRNETTISESVSDTLRLIVLLPTAAAEPETRHARFFIDSIRIGVLAVVIAAVVRLVATVVLRPGHNERTESTVRRLLDGYATTGLAWFHLLDDKLWFVGSDGQAFIGYALAGRHAVALGEPVGAPSSIPKVACEFVEFCDANGWAPVFHQVTEAGAQQLADAGLVALKIGEEAIVPVQEWDIDDKRNKSLRSALRRVERAGYHLVDLPHPIAPETIAELRAVSDAWLTTGGHRERTFTLGRFDPGYLQATTVVAAVDADGRIGAFANVLPPFRSPNGNFDLMRRRPDAPNGVMEFLFVGLIERFRHEGFTGMNLGLAPLAGMSGDTIPERALAQLYERGRQAFNFEGLRAFKDKWQPRWEARFLCYRRLADLPGATAAVVRVGELPDERRRIVRYAHRVRAVADRFPFTLGLLGIVMWFMVVTAREPTTHTTLMRHLGLSWPDLARLQVWRIATSQLVQTKSGFAWGNVALLLPIVPLAEWRLGSRRSIVTFALSDWLSTVPVVVVAHLLGVAGSASAAAFAATRDSGSSSGAWGLATVGAWLLPRGRLRVALLGLIVAFNVAAIAVERKAFQLQHLLAVAIAAGLAVVFQRRAKR